MTKTLRWVLGIGAILVALLVAALAFQSDESGDKQHGQTGEQGEKENK
ncbi:MULTISPECIES: hypothetical protein [Cupriavidus]|nr:MULTISPECIES: hypothetical protein [Cupriavidus]